MCNKTLKTELNINNQVFQDIQFQKEFQKQNQGQAKIGRNNK